MALIYRDAMLGSAPNPDSDLVRSLQRDLRRLGYLGHGVDGVLGAGTRGAIRALQYDLLRNDGQPVGENDGTAPVSMAAHNQGVVAVTGIADPALADSVDALLSNPLVSPLPESANPVAANRAALNAVAALRDQEAPTPFLLAMFAQESDGRHFSVPNAAGDTDSFVTIGLDRNDADKDRITSRGYGLGQYTLFHHPPQPAEVASFIVDLVGNVRMAYREFREKFDGFVNGHTDGTRADDRAAEHPLLDLRVCRYQPGDTRYMAACQACASEASKRTIAPDTPVYDGATETFGDANDYARTTYVGVPDRSDFRCDWPYAARRYNGSGPNSFVYQTLILRNLLIGPAAAMGVTL